MSNEDRNVTIAGVVGVMLQTQEWPRGRLFSSQTWSARRTRSNDAVQVTMRFDDRCRNGHMDFSITGTYYKKGMHEESGRIHDTICEWFPELASLIKWHSCATEGPMHYIANTIYSADQHGPTHAWVYYKGAEASDPLCIGDDGVKERLLGYEKASVAQRAVGVDGYRVQWDEATVKTRNLDFARSSACWPEATDEQLCAGKEALTAALTARLPALLAEFQTAMVDVCGFEWREPK